MRISFLYPSFLCLTENGDILTNSWNVCLIISSISLSIRVYLSIQRLMYRRFCWNFLFCFLKTAIVIITSFLPYCSSLVMFVLLLKVVNWVVIVTQKNPQCRQKSQGFNYPKQSIVLVLLSVFLMFFCHLCFPNLPNMPKARREIAWAHNYCVPLYSPDLVWGSFVFPFICGHTRYLSETFVIQGCAR